LEVFMRAAIFTQSGGPEVLRVVERPDPSPGPGEVRVAIHRSGVNPTDWKTRRGGIQFPEQIPNQDGAGVVDAVGSDVDPGRVGERVWLWEAAWRRAGGTAASFVVLPSRQAVPLPADASFDLGASLGIPALTAHRCLTVTEGGPHALHPGALADRVVLIAGGAGAVGNAAIQLARWAGAEVITTVSESRKADLARAAGAHHVINYRTEKVAEAVRAIAPDGVHTVVEVAPAANAELDAAVLRIGGTVATYATDGGEQVTLPVRPHMQLNARWQFVFVYTVPADAKDRAVADVSAAVADGALRVGEDAGLPLHHFPLDRIADAHAAVENHAVGKVLVDVA
jgi:NADPH2:quinone reductase